MPRGFGGVRQVSADLEARRGSSSPGAGVLRFRLKSGQEAVGVRFLEQDDDIFYALMHEVPVEGRQWGDFVPCLDQDKEGIPCPGCEADLQIKFQGYINVIWPEAPVFKRDEQNKIIKDSTGAPVVIGTKPQVAMWQSGIRLFEELDEINANYRGLSSRRFKVKRKGEKLDTKYVIAPEEVDGGPQEFTDEEKSLAEQKYDLNQFTQPPSYEEFQKKLGNGPVQQQSENGGGQQIANPFMRNR